MTIYPESLPFPKTTFWLHIMVCSSSFPLTHRVISPQLEREHPMAVFHKQINVGWKNKSHLYTPTNVLHSKNNNWISSVIYTGHQWNIGDGPNYTSVLTFPPAKPTPFIPVCQWKAPASSVARLVQISRPIWQHCQPASLPKGHVSAYMFPWHHCKLQGVAAMLARKAQTGLRGNFTPVENEAKHCFADRTWDPLL